MSSYLSEQRLACLGCYLKEVESGVDKVAAWKAHKERMRAPATAPAGPQKSTRNGHFENSPGASFFAHSIDIA